MGLLEYVYLSFIINYFELQESIDFNSWPILARPQLRTSHACDTLVRYRSHLAYKQPTGLFA